MSCPDLSSTSDLARVSLWLIISDDGGISGIEKVHDKPGQNTINRPSIVFAVDHDYSSVHQFREHYPRPSSFIK
jgi:hypothetical protein